MSKIEEKIDEIMELLDADDTHDKNGHNIYLAAKNIVKHITTLRQSDTAEIKRLREEIEQGDYWMKRTTEAIENGMCPECFATDEAGHKEGCYILELENKNKRLRETLGKMKAEATRMKEGWIEAKKDAYDDAKKDIENAIECIGRLEGIATTVLKGKGGEDEG